MALSCELERKKLICDWPLSLGTVDAKPKYRQAAIRSSLPSGLLEAHQPLRMTANSEYCSCSAAPANGRFPPLPSYIAGGSIESNLLD